MTHQMASVAQFSQQINLLALIHKWNLNRDTELAAIAAALGSDTATHDTTIKSGPVQTLQPGHHLNSRFTNDVLLVVNQGKAGNLTTAQMAAAITADLPAQAPVNTVLPVVSGTGTVGQVLTTNNGTWTHSPTSFLYGWRRDGVTIPGAVTATHTVVVADSGHNISSIVQGNNVGAPGIAVASSNSIAVT